MTDFGTRVMMEGKVKTGGMRLTTVLVWLVSGGREDRAKKARYL